VIAENARGTSNLIRWKAPTSLTSWRSLVSRLAEQREERLGGINALRDQLMHARDGDDAQTSISQFLDRLDRLDRYIQNWTQELAQVRRNDDSLVPEPGS